MKNIFAEAEQQGKRYYVSLDPRAGLGFTLSGGSSSAPRLAKPQREQIASPDTGFQAHLDTALPSIFTVIPKVTAWTKAIQHHNSSVVPVYTVRGLFCIGPITGFNRGGLCPGCICARLMSVCGARLQYDSLQSAQFTLTDTNILNSALNTITSSFRDDLLESLISENSCVTYDLNKDLVEVHKLLPLPGRHSDHLKGFGIPQTGKEVSNSTIEVDPVTGPVADMIYLKPAHGEPSKLSTYVARGGALGRYLDWNPEYSGSGLAFEPEKAKLAAYGEFVERYCANFVPEGLPRFSEAFLKSKQVNYVSLDSFRNIHTVNQLSTLGRHDEEREIEWARGHDWDGLPVLAPAELVYLNYANARGVTSRVPVQLAGVASHKTIQDAQRGSLLELIERDATMRWWHGGLSAQKLVPNLELRSLLSDGQEASRYRAEHYLLSLEHSVPIVATSLEDQYLNTRLLGFSCQESVSQALIKSTCEAWQLQRLAQLALDPASKLWALHKQGQIKIPLLPFTEDRAYRRMVSGDTAKLDQLFYHIQYHLDPTSHSVTTAHINQTVIEEVPVEEVETRVLKNPFNYRRFCNDFGVWFFDLTTKDYAAMGWNVVRALSADLVGNHAADLMPWQHPRLRDFPILNKEPLPHA